MPQELTLTLVGKPGCHLCDDARGAVQRVLQQFSAQNPGVPVAFIEHNILDDASLAAKYSEEIPVVLLNGLQQSFWRVNEGRLLNALVAAAR